VIDHRAFAEAPAYCGLELSPLVAGIMDTASGIAPSTLTDEQASEFFGCPLSGLPSEPRRTVAIRTGGRGGKTSRLVATKALHAAWTVPLPDLRRGEVASSLLVAPDLKLARQALSFVVGYVEGSSVLRKALVEAPTKDSLELRRADGKRVRVEVLAASRGGRGVRGRTLVFAGLDEACFFLDETTGVVNDADLYRAVLQRVAPGGQVWIVSTPWLADTGLLETTIAKNWGRHEHALVCTASTRAMNPSWDPTGEVERDMRAQDPDAAVREIDGLPMAGGASTFFDHTAIKRAVDESIELPVAPSPGTVVSCGADFGFKSDSSACVVVHKVAGRHVVADVVERRPERGAPLKPSEVVKEFASVLQRHRASYLRADGHYREAVREHLYAFDLGFVNGPEGATGKLETYTKARALLHEGKVTLPNHPRLLKQLREVVSRPTPGGGLTITSPRWRGSGGHGDLVSALVLALHERHGSEVERPLTGAEQAHRQRKAIWHKHWEDIDAIDDPAERAAVEGVEALYQEEQREARYWRSLGIEWEGRRR
jgi:hypothetical protein